MRLLSLHSAHLALSVASLVLSLVVIYFLLSSLHVLEPWQTSLSLAYRLLKKVKSVGLELIEWQKLPDLKVKPWDMRLSKLKNAWRMIVVWRENHFGKVIKRKGWVRLYSMFWVCFTLLIVVVVSYGFTHPRDFPIEKHHHVYVWSQVKGTTNTWLMSGDGLPLTEWNCCPDFPCETVIWPGYIAYLAKWEERGKCKSIRGNGLGFFWERDELGNVKEW